MSDHAFALALQKCGEYGVLHPGLVQSVANGIREAVAAEREACAKIAESELPPTGYAHIFEDGYRAALYDAAHAIRNRHAGPAAG